MIYIVSVRFKLFFEWLLPYYFGHCRKCPYCKDLFSRDRGFKADGYGWFCSENHFEEFYRNEQW